MRRALGLAILPPVALLLAASAVNAQGFGKIKHKVVLRRKLPPIAHLTGSFAVRAEARDKQNAETAQKVADILETSILQHDNQLIPDKNKPDTVIICNVISY